MSKRSPLTLFVQAFTPREAPPAAASTAVVCPPEQAATNRENPEESFDRILACQLETISGEICRLMEAEPKRNWLNRRHAYTGHFQEITRYSTSANEALQAILILHETVSQISSRRQKQELDDRDHEHQLDKYDYEKAKWDREISRLDHENDRLVIENRNLEPKATPQASPPRKHEPKASKADQAIANLKRLGQLEAEINNQIENAKQTGVPAEELDQLRTRLTRSVHASFRAGKL